MSVVIIPYNCGLQFGAVEESTLPKLPTGYRYKIEPEAWVKAISPDGREWYVVTGPTPHLELCQVATRDYENRTHGRLKVGEEFIDSEEIIAL